MLKTRTWPSAQMLKSVGFLQGASHRTTASRMGIDMASGAVSRQRRALHAGRVVDPLVHEGCSESRIRGRLE